uniref:uncharacterized protein LOC122583155 n=1 Tax=Erigeron canadensis TaxID=72917 RepID=UPI001CB9A093|nr:uncharacterized protein LOC122583155 [Erigeron canadensis]
MGGMRNKVSKGVKGYWPRRGYHRLANDEPRSKRSWRIRIPSRLKIKIRFKFNPSKFIARIHDGYVRMMTRVANSPSVSRGAINGYGIGGRTQFGLRTLKEYDDKIIIEMYKSLAMKQAQLIALDHQVIERAPQITCSG